MEMGDTGKHPDHDFLPRFPLPLSLPPCFPLSLCPSFFVSYLLALCYYFLSFIFFSKVYDLPVCFCHLWERARLLVIRYFLANWT